MTQLTSPAAAPAFREVSSGEFHTCGLTTDDRAYCWGANGGTLGDGTTADRLVPAAVAGGLRFRNLTAGGDQHTCGVTLDHLAYCWGLNGAGQLGDGTTVLRTTPVLVAGGRRFRQLSAGLAYTCGVTYEDGRAFCWGRNDFGQLGVGDQLNRLLPTPVYGGRAYRQISASEWFAGHTCALTTATEIYCWGSNRYGQLGDGTAAKRRVRPVLVVGDHAFAQVEVGSRHSCAVTTEQRAFCWGYGLEGELGIGQTFSSPFPWRVFRGLRFVMVTAGLGQTCGLTTTGEAYCWGAGPLGNGSTTRELKPVPVAGGLLFASLSAASGHTCGTTTAAVAYCWGDNGWGQLGDATKSTRLVPTAVSGPS